MSTDRVGLRNASYSLVQNVFVQNMAHVELKTSSGVPTAHRWTFRLILKFLRDRVLPSDATLLTQVRTALLSICAKPLFIPEDSGIGESKIVLEALRRRYGRLKLSSRPTQSVSAYTPSGVSDSARKFFLVIEDAAQAVSCGTFET